MAARGVTTYRRFTEEYRKQAVGRLQGCGNVSALCREMGISRQLLYQWKHRSEHRRDEPETARKSEQRLRRQLAELKQSLAEMRLQMDAFNRALYRVEALRQTQRKQTSDDGSLRHRVIEWEPFPSADSTVSMPRTMSDMPRSARSRRG